MADKTIGQLQAASQVTPTDLFVLEQSGVAKKLTGQTLENWLLTFADGHGGIQSIAKTSTSGLTDTYTITLSDNTTVTFTVRNGKGISSVTTYYAVSTSGSTVPSSWSTTRQTMTATNKYLWSYQHIAFNDNTSVDTVKTVIGVYGDKGDKGNTGDTGNGISSLAQTGRVAGEYTIYTFTMTNGTTQSFNAYDGVGISSINTYYAVSADGTTPPTSWSESRQNMTATNRYLWSYQEIHLSDNTTISTQQIVIGVYGDKGDKGDPGEVTQAEFDELDGEVDNLQSALNAVTGTTRNLWAWDSSVTLTKGTNNFYQVDYVPVDSSLTLSFDVLNSDVLSILVNTSKNGTQQSSNSLEITSGRVSITLPTVDFDRFRIALKSAAPTGAVITITNIQLESGTVATPFVPPVSAVDNVARSEISEITEVLNYVSFIEGESSGLSYVITDDGLMLNGTTTAQVNIPIGQLSQNTYLGECKIISGNSSKAIALRYSFGSGYTYWCGTNTTATQKEIENSAALYLTVNVNTVCENCVVSVNVRPADKTKTAIDFEARRDIDSLKDSTKELASAYLPQTLLPKYNAFTCVNKRDINLSASSHILAYGDSITHGGEWGTSWIDFVCQIIGCTSTNKAVTGALFGEEVRTSGYWISTQLSNTSDSEWNSATLVVVAAGTNDAGYNTEDTELYNKVQSAITTIRTHTQAPILFVTPIKRGPSDDDANYFELPKISGIIEHVALLNKCSVVCGLNFPIPSHDEGVISGMMDGYIHPNSDGGYIYAVSVLQNIL